MEACADRDVAERNAAIRLAWLNAFFQRAKDFPDLEGYLLKRDRAPEPELTAEQKDARIWANLRAMRKAFEK